MNFIEQLKEFLVAENVSVEALRAGDIHIATIKRADLSQPLRIAEDRWHSQQTLTKKRIMAHLGHFRSVFARNCIVRRIDKKLAASFLSEHHSYGDASCRYRYGLFTKNSDELVAVSEFSNARSWEKEGRKIRSYEWVRYASCGDVRVVGGMGKMLQAFIDEIKPDDIMSYADLEWSDGEVYRALGFVEDGIKEPVEFEIDPIKWTRRPLKNLGEKAGALLYRNEGSLKYRLKLTDY